MIQKNQRHFKDVWEILVWTYLTKSIDLLFNISLVTTSK